MKFGFIRQAVSEKKMFESNGHVYAYSPGSRADSPLRSKFFQKHKSSVTLVIRCNFYPLNDFVTFFPLQTHRRPNLTLA